MTTEQIQSRLIDHYSLAIERVKEAGTFDEVKGVIGDMFVDLGVCLCSEKVLNAPIVSQKWVKKHKGLGQYWGPVPFAARLKKQILSRLQLRLDILKKEYSLSIETIKPSSV